MVLPLPHFGSLDLPEFTYLRIVQVFGTGDLGREKLFSEFLSHHPFPSWEVVVDYLEDIVRNRGRESVEYEWFDFVSAAEIADDLAKYLKNRYLTSE